jgi:hypothetical protein
MLAAPATTSLSDAAARVPGGRRWEQAAKQLAREQALQLAKQERHEGSDLPKLNYRRLAGGQRAAICVGVL